MKKIIAAAILPILMMCGCGSVGKIDGENVPTVVTAEPTTAVSTFETEVTTNLPPEPATAPPSAAEICLSGMTLHEKICQMFIVEPEKFSPEAAFTIVGDNFRGGYAEYPVGGFIFFTKNIVSSEQTSAMLADIQDTALQNGVGVFLAVDEEGGYVTRVQSQLGTEAVYSMRCYGDLNDREQAFSVGETIGDYLADYGFNVDFAPVADVNISPWNELGSRIFSSDPHITAEMSAAVSEGLQSKGVCSTLKHFPGLGAGSGNTHYGSVYIERTYDELLETEFTAFRGGIEAGCDFVMVGHQITAASKDDLPGDLSSVVVGEWLRNTLRFDGIAITDSHSMGAIANVYDSGEAAVRAVEAGMDIILMPHDLPTAVKGLTDAVNSREITEERINESVLRILEKKSELGLL